MNITQLMRQFSIRTRMIASIVVVLVLLFVVGGAGLFGLKRVLSLGDEFMRDSLIDTNHLGNLRTVLGNLRQFEKDIIISYEKLEEVARFKKLWSETREKANAQVAMLKERRNGSETITRLEGELARYAAGFAPVIKNLEESNYDSATAANRVMGRARDAATAAHASVQELQDQITAEAVAGEAARLKAVQETVIMFATAVALAIGIIVPFTIINMRTICRPLTEAQTLAAAIARGDLTSAVQVLGNDESAQLMHALSEMQESLRKVVGQVRDSTDSINSASGEIALGNLDLSVRTEKAAANLQQAASSMEQFTGTIRQSADSARQANQLASSAAEVAQRGGSVVSQVVRTMDEINASSKKISDIIGVIDGIAFQTNILALNAAVEAARAGEQGRGFAVVASEVRSLASRSAEAAKEIKGLIGTSVDRVEAGSRLVADAGKTMTEIVSSVQRVSDIIGEITAASSEQSDGIGQVNTSVTQLDQMTQQNAALVEESAAASESLKEQARRLSEVVSIFRLASAPASAGPAPVRPTESPVRAPAPPAPKPMPAAPAAAAARKAAPAVAAAPKPVAAASAAASKDDWETF